MHHARPSPFFHKQLLDAPRAPREARRRLTHGQRRALAWLVSLVIVAVAVFGAIYLAHPERFHQPKWRAPRSGEQTITKTLQREPGVVDVEVKRGKETRTFRFRRVKDKTSVEDVTPEQDKHKSWWQRLFGG